MLPFPFYFAGFGINGAERAPKWLGIVVWKIRAAVISMSLFVGLRSCAENVALLARGDVEKFCLRIVSGRHPVRRSSGSRADAIPFQRRRGVFEREGTSFGVFRSAPGNFGVRIRGD